MNCRNNPLLLASVLCCFCAVSSLFSAEYSRIDVTPQQVVLQGKDASFQLLITGYSETGKATDLTRTASYRIDGESLVQLNDSGIIRSLQDGRTRVVVMVDDREISVPVSVDSSDHRISLNFENDIEPILSRYRCNTSGCHGKAEGQNGFKLSVFGFDPVADYSALVMEARGRRVFPSSPERSLLLQKMSGGIPHGGGIPIDPARPEYRTVRDWILEGMPVGSPEDAVVTKIQLTPNQQVMHRGDQQQLRVVATMSDGRQVDVTELAQFRSNAAAQAVVDPEGLITTGQSPGVVAVMATYMGNVDVFKAFIPRVEGSIDFPEVAENNSIDSHVNNQLKKLNIIPSGRADDASYLRRVYVDLIGTLPTAEETRQFLTDVRADKRSLIVDALMERPEFADYWALKWSDLLRVDRLALGHKNAYSYYNWIRTSFKENKPLDELARDLITAEGPLREQPAGTFYKAVGGANKQASTLSQVLLGIRIECAECHHHPWDRWSQQDYFGMQAFFTQVKFKPSNVGEMVYADGNPSTKHPRSGEEVFAHALGEAMPESSPTGDRRSVLADWMTDIENPWFARNMANRAWAHFMGRGVVEPVDDIRLTNPPSNAALLDDLAEYLTKYNFDFRELIRYITASATYQRSSEVNESNNLDEQNYSRFLFKQLPAEVFLDAISQTTGVPAKFDGVPHGSRAIQLWDSSVKDYFLKTFGRPARATACECERIGQPTVTQVLHILNSPDIQEKLIHKSGRVQSLIDKVKDDGQLIEELYLTFYGRMPLPQEIEYCSEYLETADNRLVGASDIAWSLMNSLEFVFNH